MTSDSQRPRRSLLYVPGNDLHKIHKAATLDADCVCLDLEDGVAPGQKAAARQSVAEALRTLNFGRAERLFRINNVGSGLEVDDLTAILPGRPDGVVVPKVSDPGQVLWVSEQLTAAEEAYGLERGSIRMLVIVESARGVVFLREIARAGPRLEALIFGAEDLAGDIGATRTAAGWEVFYARSALVTCAAAFGLQALDMVYVNFRDLEGLRREARQGAEMGFSGKQVIHPLQVQPVQEAFTPSAEAIAHARRILEAYSAHQAKGAGAFEMDGVMVDMPVVRVAEGVLARARVAGVI